MNTIHKQSFLPIIKGITLLICFIAVAGCRTDSRVPANPERSAANNNSASIDEADLLEQIWTFSTDEGELSQAAWKKLKAYPRQELIDHLSRMQSDSNKNELIKTCIAFVLCNLDQDYLANREIIVSAFNQSLDTADTYERQIDRLIQHGDKELLQVLFAIAPRSDGALSEGLASTFAEQMKRNTEAFLTELGTQARPTRLQVSYLVNLAASDEDKIMIKAFLKLIPASSPLAGLAKEMESDLSQVRID